MFAKLILPITVFFVLCNFAARAGIDPITPMEIRRVQVLEVEATINPAVANYIQTELSLADKHPGTLFVIKLNTPGGLVSTTKDILAMFGRAQTPVVVWVTPEGASATSAGAIIASGAHLILMSPGTNIGAATPVALGEDLKESDGRSKAINDLTALVKALSQSRGRNPQAFAQMIEKSASFSAGEALKQGIVDGIISHLDEARVLLADKVVLIQGKKHLLKFAPIVEVLERPMDAGQRLLNVLAHPSTAYILFVLGALLLYFEFQAPGGYVAGAIGVLCLLTAGIAFQVLPLNFGAIALLAAGVGLLVLEVFITSYGLLALAGLACLVAGSLFLYRHEDGWMTVQYPIIFSSLAGVVVFGALLVWYIARENAKNTNKVFFSLVSEPAQILSAMGEMNGEFIYQVRVKGEIWRARSLTPLSPGDSVRVTAHSQDQLLLTVSKQS